MPKNIMPTPCQYCKFYTNRTYRDSRNSDIDNNTVSCCQDCASEKPYLEISQIFKPKSATSIDQDTLNELEELT